MTAPRPWTPGPWLTRAYFVYAPGERGANVCAISEPRASTTVGYTKVELGGDRDGEGYANLRLIASAPDLFEALAEWVALRDAVAEAGGMDGPLAQETIDAFAERQRLVVDRARAALAKARGEQKETP